MDIVIARFLHIIAGVLWIGAGVATVFVINPFAAKLRGQGERTIDTLYSTNRWTRYMTVTAITTLLAGLYLAYRFSGGFQRNWMSQNGMIVLTIGAVAGVLGLIHGGAVLSPMQGKTGALVTQMGNSPTSEQQTQFDTLIQQVRLHDYISLALAVIAVGGMAIARYVY